MPWKKLIVHEVKKVDIGALLQQIINQTETQKMAGTPTIAWVDGYALGLSFFPDTPEIIAQKLEGKLHYAVVTFAETSYEPSKRVTYNGREYQVKLLKIEDNQDLKNLVAFLRGLETSEGQPPQLME